MLGADRPVYATPLENLRAAQAAVDELNGLGADELPYMTRRIQQLIDAAAESPPPRREHGATSRTPAVGLGSPSSVTQKAAPELWNDEAIHLLPRLVGRDIPPRRLLRIRLSAAD